MLRSPKEREVSISIIIPRAIALSEFESNIEQYRHNKVTVVAYCIIGYRSGKYARELTEQGINILDLEGNLLA